MTALDTKIEYITGLIAGIEEDFAQCTEEETPEDEQLLNLFKSYELLLLNQKNAQPTTPNLHWLYREAIRDAGCLLENIANNAADQLEGWNTFIKPTNSTQEFVSLTSSIIMELGKAVWNFEAARPHLKAEFDADRAEYAKRIAAQEAAQ